MCTRFPCRCDDQWPMGQISRAARPRAPASGGITAVNYSSWPSRQHGHEVWVCIPALEDLGTGSPGSCCLPSQCSAFRSLFTAPWRESAVMVLHLQEAVNAVSWVHQLSGLEPISQSPFIQATVAGLKRSLAKPRVRKGASYC